MGCYYLKYVFSYVNPSELTIWHQLNISLLTAPPLYFIVYARHGVLGMRLPGPCVAGGSDREGPGVPSMRLPNVPARFAAAGGTGGRVPGKPKQVDSKDAFSLFKAGTLAGMRAAEKGTHKDGGNFFSLFGEDGKFMYK
jgi:hypothetical protein